MQKLLSHINSPEDLRKIPEAQLENLAKELRSFIIDIVAVKEGHLGASLGVVELTLALHYVFNTPDDPLVWDVGHQAYGHKILTGRRDNFDTNRQYKGISGFPKRSESEYDVFGTGHSSTSISAVLGMAIASKLADDNDRHHIAVIGDASIASGMAFEGLNHAGVTHANLIVILNDNAIGIDPSVGALKQYLTNVKSGSDTHDNIFEALDFDYSGPVDGHDLKALISELKKLKKGRGPRLLHITTLKGKGLDKAEKDQVKYHAPGKFDPVTGNLHETSEPAVLNPPKFQDVFGYTLVELAEKNEKIIGITPAMPTGSSMKYMMQAFPERGFDVGIAEQHAVTLAAGMCTQGLIPFCNIYSTFLQRSYDQVIHDVALQKLPVIFCLDRAGLVGQDGATHHGVFDIPSLRCIPNLIIAAARNASELRNLMFTAQNGIDNPIAIRYPRGHCNQLDWRTPFTEIEIGKSVCLRKGSTVAVLSIGPIADNVEMAIKTSHSPEAFSHFDMRFVKPLDEVALHSIFKKYSTVVSVEDGALTGGFGSALAEFKSLYDYSAKLICRGIPDRFIDHGSILELQGEVGLDVKSLTELFDGLI